MSLSICLAALSIYLAVTNKLFDDLREHACTFIVTSVTAISRKLLMVLAWEESMARSCTVLFLFVISD